MPKKICNYQGCNELISYTEKYCQKHKIQRQTEQKESTRHYDSRIRSGRDKTYSDFYHSKEWERMRKIALVRDNGLCQKCLEKNQTTLADIVHHKVEIKDDWNKRLQLDNLVCLCNACHNSVHSKG